MEEARAFWIWFAENLGALESWHRGDPGARDMIDEITRRVQAVHPRLNWEFGPEGTDGRFFAFSVEGDRDLLRLSTRAVQLAPSIPGWTFRATKPPREWIRRIVQLPLGGRAREISFDAWQFHARRLGDGVLEIRLYGDALEELTESQRLFLGWFLLDSELGERFTTEHAIELHVEPSGTAPPDARPITELRSIAPTRWETTRGHLPRS